MLTVHHLGISQSERIVWLCEELEIPYEFKRYDREPSGMGPPAYKALHALGSAPIITDGEVVLPESAAIMDYIIAKYGQGRLAVKPEAPNFADYLFWYHFTNGTFMPAHMSLMMVRFIGPTNEEGIKFLGERVDKLWDLIEQRLGQTPYFAGHDFTAADVIMGFPLTTMRAFVPRDLGPLPNIRAYLARIGERPAYQRAMKKAEPQMTPMLG
jgi:glutathione S-transferase